MPIPRTKWEIRRAFQKAPLRPYTEWAKMWGVTRSYVAHLRKESGVPMLNELHRVVRNHVRTALAARGGDE